VVEALGHAAPFDTPASIGILPGVVDSVIVLPPHLDVLERRLATDNDIVAVITEGSGASYGTVPLPPRFVAGVRRLTKQYGVIMILDGVITGFRWSLGVCSTCWASSPISAPWQNFCQVVYPAAPLLGQRRACR
jgi:glutamate-1-semialdehyde 2,1-aminomutase